MIDINLLLRRGAIHRRFEKAQAIFCQGGAPNFYYQIVKGKVKMVSCNENGREFIQAIYTEGETFGEASLLDGGTYPYSAVAEEDSIVIRLNKESFFELLKQDTAIHSTFTCLLAHRLRFAVFLLKEVSCYGPQHRIYTLIKYLKSASGQPDQLRYKVELTRQQMADMTGLRVETVIRVIRLLYDRGEVTLEKGKVYL
jgi:CRP/FNR family cyclic AMP-dependent transcriptional regulator